MGTRAADPVASCKALYRWKLELEIQWYLAL